MARIGILLTVAALAFVGRAAMAGNFVVIEADGIRLPAGQTVNGAQPLKLDDGQAITLLSEDGQTIHIDGPSTASPDSLAKGGNGDVKTAMAALITESHARTSEVGVVRGQGEVRLPDPWVVDITHPGTSCVRDGEPVVLWRGPPLAAADIAFAPKDRSWNVHGTWPANSDRVTLPANMPLKGQLGLRHRGRRTGGAGDGAAPAEIGQQRRDARRLHARGRLRQPAHRAPVRVPEIVCRRPREGGRCGIIR